MITNAELEELKALVFQDSWDEDSKRAINELEARLQQSAIAENLGENEIIKPFVTYLAERIANAKEVLTTKRTTSVEQEYLFAIIELATRFTSLFTGEAREAAEKAIKHNLDVAKSRH